MTTDPYAECEREPFQNPFKPGDSAYQKYEGRTVYADYKACLANAKRGYATVSLARAGRISAPDFRVTPAEVMLF